MNDGDYQVVLSDTAIADLMRFAEYIISESGFRRTALAFVDRTEQRCLGLATAPYSGRSREDLGPGVRLMPFESVVIAYRVSVGAVTITNIFHAAQDYEALLRLP
jgi:toxin ParE1/3/4